MADNTQNKPIKEDSEKIDEYHGQYKEADAGKSEAEKYGTDQLPVQHDPLPGKGLKTFGG